MPNATLDYPTFHTTLKARKYMKIHSLSFLLWTVRSIFSSASAADETVINRVLLDSNDAAAGQWSSLTPNVDFSRILMDSKYDKVADQIIDRTLSSSVASSSSCSFAPSSQNDYYPEYAVAWRYLGISVDCNYQDDRRRNLQDNNNQNQNNNNNNGNMCARVLLYAVYVDVNHDENLGLDQYSFYDRKSNTWSQCAGKYYADDANNANRCVKMDCHAPDTQNFKLLGLYKNYEMHQWMEQLFKHEGVCVWSSDEYTYAQNSRDMVKDDQCVATGTDSSGTILYGGVGPLPGGNIGVTLYTDATCNNVYIGETTIDGLCAGQCNNNNNKNKRDLKNDNNNAQGACGSYCNANAFNDAMNVWKQCQPCTAYTPGYYGSYQCEDAAGYKNCLQCMKFKAKAGSEPADLSDLYNAHVQESLLSIEVCGQKFGEFGYGYDGGVPSYSAAVKLQKDAMNLVPTYHKPPRDGSKAYFALSIIAILCAAGLFSYYHFVGRKSKGASLRLQGNREGMMS